MIMKSMKRNLSLIVYCLIALITCAVAEAQQNRPRNRRRAVLNIPDVAKKDIICFALYTVHDKTLKLTAQLYPRRRRRFQDGAPRGGDADGEVGRGCQDGRPSTRGWTAPFRVERLGRLQGPHKYRVAHGTEAFVRGHRPQATPIDKDELVVAGVHRAIPSTPPTVATSPARTSSTTSRRSTPTCSSSRATRSTTTTSHYAAWLKFGRDFGEIIKDRPTLCLPDDHDAGQPNLWGESGKVSTLGGASDGGYSRPGGLRPGSRTRPDQPLPRPRRPRTRSGKASESGSPTSTGATSTSPIIEDRKFKTGPAGRVPKQGPRPDHIRNPDYDPASVDVKGAVLLGERQLKFLDSLGHRTGANADMKMAVLTRRSSAGEPTSTEAPTDVFHADMDSNGWPQSGRNRALRALRKGFRLPPTPGDQHLATIFHHGIDEHRDAIWSFCVPSIANLYLRWWEPLEPGKPTASPARPEYTGDHLDGFANKVTNFAAANPEKKPAGNILNTRSAGFGIVRLNTKSRDITMECWPRNVDITDGSGKQYPGWPRTISQFDNYRPPSWGTLGEISFDVQDPVVQIVDGANDEVLYTVRVKGNKFTPYAPNGRSFIVKAGQNSPDTVVVKSASVGGAPQDVSLR